MMTLPLFVPCGEAQLRKCGGVVYIGENASTVLHLLKDLRKYLSDFVSNATP
jgi:hypothetical protein